MTRERPQSPHDSLVRAVFGHPEHAVGLIRALLPEVVARAIDWEELAPVSASFVGPELSQRHCDLLFQAPIEGRQALLYTLIEHKSGPEPMLPFQLLRYQVQIWEWWLEEHPERRAGPLPAILPFVLYHARGAWRLARDLADLYDLTPELRESMGECLLRQRFYLEDLAAREDHELRARMASALARLTLVVLKHARYSPDLIERLAACAGLFRDAHRAQSGPEALHRVLRYILSVSDIRRPEDLASALRREAGDEIGEAVMTEQGRFMKECLQKGLQEGLQEGMQQGQRQMLVRLLRRRFGDIPDAVVERVENADPAVLEVWSENVLDAVNLEDVFEQ